MSSMHLLRFFPLVPLLSLAMPLACSSGSTSTPNMNVPTSDGGTGTVTPPNECPAPSAPAKAHGGLIDADETWDAGEHLVTSEVTVRTNVTLTIAPCAVVKLAKDVSITIDDDAEALIAEGTATRPISFERSDSSTAWGAVVVYAPATARLAHVTMRGGGTTTTANTLDAAPFAGATLVLRDQSPSGRNIVRVDHVTVDGSTGLGVMLDSTGFFEGSTDLTVKNAGSYPVYLGAAYATNLPPGTYTPNGKAEFLLQSVGPAVYANTDPVLADATLRNRGLPYVVGRNGGSILSIGDGRSESPKAVFTIEAGVELRFRAAGSELGQVLVRAHKPTGEWAAQGTLIANGTASAPIVFTSQSATPQPGDWQGLYYEHVADPRNSVQNAVITYAGGESSSIGLCKASPGASNFDADCSVILWLDAAPASAFITNTRIENGRGCGIYRAWKGAQVDFGVSNTFSSVAGCPQSNVAPLSGSCDSTGSCF